jgi:hypothetical protein
VQDLYLNSVGPLHINDPSSGVMYINGIRGNSNLPLAFYGYLVQASADGSVDVSINSAPSTATFRQIYLNAIAIQRTWLCFFVLYNCLFAADLIRDMHSGVLLVVLLQFRVMMGSTRSTILTVSLAALLASMRRQMLVVFVCALLARPTAILQQGLPVAPHAPH